ncbi:hypothetical protein HW260_00250 [Helicobacter cinaedi]|uniref:Uncharacterized protein n=1 Tax=Helicobacter cinaedi CCUG 18818 = ATCC BAA-847 TaxID=537971 RepID=A0AAI8MPB4_9HELI|nr:hypothetical protein [Helicobacter cinaedi]EFR45899.1 hypothetical protein HCCG_00445 [Helicobacter cinaedi CCUG 18818 = ATCC BAA-847]QOQ90840.1 hypothetical protein HW260_00250 [Helicobacter cinaedi]BAM33258.1 hypothetical protein HCBAA847_2040 [Helicobacter cinaedi CCUG 18818 = ATCC BAA-847]
MIKQSNNIGQSTPLKQQESHKQNKEFLQYAKDFATQMQEEVKKLSFVMQHIIKVKNARII